MPNPAVLFMALCAGVIVLSQVLDWIGVTSEVVSPTGHDVVRHAFAIRGLLSGAGIRFMVVTILVTS